MTNIAPGWYADPIDPSLERWWDGTANTASTRSRPPVHFGSGLAISPKSRTVATILGFFLGGFGIDRFYLGNIGMGIAKLLLGWATAGIWPLIDWIIIVSGNAHDGDGLPVVNWS